MKRVTLVGGMGSGKTTLSQVLAGRWGWDAVDLDRRIEEKAPEHFNLDGPRAMSIPTLFEAYGEPAFRRLERTCLDEVLGREDVVIATGGGTPAQPGGAMDDILKAGAAVWLRGDTDALLDRALATSNRPLLADLTRGEAREIYAALETARRPHYARATVSVDVTEGAPRIIAERIEDALASIGHGPWTR